jgi:hypothetical protein
MHMRILSWALRATAAVILPAAVLGCGLGVTTLHWRELPFVGALRDA